MKEMDNIGESLAGLDYKGISDMRNELTRLRAELEEEKEHRIRGWKAYDTVISQLAAAEERARVGIAGAHSIAEMAGYRLTEAQRDLATLRSQSIRVDGLRGMILAPDRPKVICLCGSTRFWKEFQRASLRETMNGNIILSIGAASGTDDEHFGNLPREEYDRVKTMLDELHKRKIDLADEALVLNVGGYIGDSTRSEVVYALDHGKPVRWLEPDKAWEPDASRRGKEGGQ